MYIVTPISTQQNSSVSGVRSYALPAGANAFWVQAISQNVRIQIDGTDPTASVGAQIKAGDPIRLLLLGGGRSFKALQESATAYFYCQPVKVSWVEP